MYLSDTYQLSLVNMFYPTPGFFLHVNSDTREFQLGQSDFLNVNQEKYGNIFWIYWKLNLEAWNNWTVKRTTLTRLKSSKGYFQFYDVIGSTLNFNLCTYYVITPFPFRNIPMCTHLMSFGQGSNFRGANRSERCRMGK